MSSNDVPLSCNTSQSTTASTNNASIPTFTNNSVSEPNLINSSDAASAVSLLETFAAIARRRTTGGNFGTTARYN